ncbi:MAG TPA: sigma-70 family RNA polymerase sigma factor [Kofleriaceae bacterium]|nr:sigma-70 family RNA polymerase sigma factor [Kofleriaceae bacterium]
MSKHTQDTTRGVEPGRIDAGAYYLRYGPMVLRRCRHLLRDDERARDAMHDVFVNVLRYQERLDESAPSSLLYRMATNVCLNQLRTARRRPEVPDDAVVDRTPDHADAESTIASRSVLARLFAADLGPLAPIAALRYRDGLSVNEVAREVGLSATSVRKRLHLLRDHLPGLVA